MNKKIKIILPISLMLLIGLVIFVSASQVESGVAIYKGWNLIYGFTPSSLNGQGFDFSHIKAIYTYIPIDNEYIRIYPNPQNSKIDKFGDSYFEKQVMWVYSDLTVEGELNGYAHFTEYWLEEPLPLSQRQDLYKGWNFVGITSDMIGEGGEPELRDLVGDCNIERAYFFNPEQQEWVVFPLDEDFSQDAISSGIVIKVSENCKLGGNGVSPPPLPDTITNLPPETTPETNDLNFPQTIGEYTLKSKNINDKTECGQLDGDSVCVQMSRIEYVTSDNRAVHVLPTKINSGKNSYINYIKTRASEKNVGGIAGVYRGAEPWELYWFTNNDYDMIGTQDYKYIPQSDGYNSQTLNGTTTSSVAKWLLNKYPPII